MKPNEQPKLILIRALKQLAKGEVSAEQVQMHAYLALGGRIEDGKMIDLENL